MQIYTGPNDVVRAVTRVGSSGIAALADSGVSVWEPGQTDRPTILPAKRSDSSVEVSLVFTVF